MKKTQGGYHRGLGRLNVGVGVDIGGVVGQPGRGRAGVHL
jgi:hypothetical protein